MCISAMLLHIYMYLLCKLHVFYLKLNLRIVFLCTHIRRFNQVDTVIREVANLVKTHPTAFIDIPDALQVTDAYMYIY